MSIFTPVASLTGGLLIGASAVLLLTGIGRMAGISGITYGIWREIKAGQRQEWLWRVAFLAGLMVGAWGYMTLSGADVHPRTGFSPLMLIVGGLIVGYGTSLGNGCTSGHGVCGLGRLSVRSLVATLTFMGTGALTVFVVRHVLAT